MKNLLQSSLLLVLLVCFLTPITGAQSKKGNGTITTYSMELSALCGKNTTDVYVRIKTSDEKNFPIPDVLKKLSVKIRDTSGVVVYNKNFFKVKMNNNEAVVSIDENLLHNSLEVRVHIKTQKTKNEKLLNGKTVALLRPDLVINKLIHPDTVNINEPFNIEAYIVEINKELGASADISLYEGDQLIRKINNFNIGAGGNVSAAFQNLIHVDTGWVNYKVYINNSSPQEFDTTNNQKSFSIYFSNPASLHAMRYSANYYLNKNILDVTSNVSSNSTVSDTLKGEASGFQCYYSLSNVDFDILNNIFPIKNVAIRINTEEGNFVNINSSDIKTGAAYSYYYSGSFNDTASGVALNYSYNPNYNSLTFILFQYLSDNVYISNQNGSVTVTENHNKILDAEKSLTIDLEVKIAKDYYGGRINFETLPQLQLVHGSFSYDYYDWSIGENVTYSDSYSYKTIRTLKSGVTDTTYFSKKSLNNLAAIVPSSTELKQNYPNPFNPETNISYQLSKNGPVNLTVYDILGNKIATLINRTQSAGSYNINFNGNNLASGVYIYRLQTVGYTATRKFILQK